MHSGDSDMRRVGRRFPREDAGSQNGRREMSDFGRDIEQVKFSDDQYPFSRRVRVSRAHLINDQLRDENFESSPSLFPPLFGNLLVAGHDQIPAGSRGKIARNGRFHVESLLHMI